MEACHGRARRCTSTRFIQIRVCKPVLKCIQTYFTNIWSWTFFFLKKTGPLLNSLPIDKYFICSSNCVIALCESRSLRPRRCLSFSPKKYLKNAHMEMLSPAYSEWYWFQEMLISVSVLKQCFSKRSGSNFMHDDLQCSVQKSHQIISPFNGKKRQCRCSWKLCNLRSSSICPRVCQSHFEVNSKYQNIERL